MNDGSSTRVAAHPVRTFRLSGLEGISDETLEIHFKLYEGYVKAVNEIEEAIADLVASGKGSTPQHAELVRRRAFELDGVVLHEHYFANLTSDAADLAASSPFARAATLSFGSVAEWKKDFLAVAGMRGVGWALTVQEPSTGRLMNHWISLHEMGHVAGYRPVLVMDLWEHAWFRDYEPAERAKYVEAFFQNVAWGVVDARLRDAIAPHAATASAS